MGSILKRLTIKVSVVLVDVTLELVEEPVPTVDDGNTDYVLPMDWQTVLGDGLSIKGEVMPGVECCDSVVGEPTSAFLDNAGGFVDLAGGVPVGVTSTTDLHGRCWGGVPGLPCWRCHHRSGIPGHCWGGISGRCWGGVPGRPCWWCHRRSGIPGRCWGGVPGRCWGSIPNRPCRRCHRRSDIPGRCWGGVPGRCRGGVPGQCWGGALAVAGVESLTYFAEVASSADLAGNVTVGVMLLVLSFREKYGVLDGSVYDVMTIVMMAQTGSGELLNSVVCTPGPDGPDGPCGPDDEDIPTQTGSDDPIYSIVQVNSVNNVVRASGWPLR